MKKTIKLFDPVVGLEEENAIRRVLKSNFWASGAGVGNVSKFENMFQRYVKSDECIAVNSGSSALNLALSLINIKNKEVILPSLTFISTAHAIIQNGGKPVFVDVNKNMCLDTDNLKKFITKKTRVILPVHFAGFPCDLDSIQEICENHSLYLIEDAAHAAGASYKNKKIGSHGFATCFSFHPVKNLAMPTGGLISLNSKNHKRYKEELFSKRWCGITNRKNYSYDVKTLGWNNYMNEFSAAIGIVQLKKLDKINNVRKKIAKKYSKELTCEIKIPFNDDCSYHIYWIMTKNRTNFMKKLKESGIETGIHYRPIHTMSMYKGKYKLQMTEKAGNHIVSIPIHPNLMDENIDKIIKNVNQHSESI